MLRQRIKDIAKDSSIYGISKVLGQLVSFFLIPLYTEYLTQEEYGILSIIGITSVSITYIMNFGIDSATYRYAALSKDEAQQRQYINNARFLTILFALLFSLFYFIFLSELNAIVLTKQTPKLYMMLGLGLSLPATFSSVVSANLRINRKVKIVAISSLLNVFTTILVTLLLVVKFKMGMLGSLLGNLSGNLLSSLFIVIRAPRFSYTDINVEKIKDLLRYSTPTLLAQLFGLTIPLYSQWSIKELLSLHELGLYAIALKFTIPLTVVLTMFQQAYAPYKFQILKTDKDPKKVFIQIMNLFVMCFGIGIIMVTLFGGDVLKLMTASSYHEAAFFVFYLALIPFAQGLYFMFSTGIEFSKSPAFRPLISGLGLITVLMLNNYLIKKFGVPGAAISIVCSWLSMALGNLIYSQFLYRIKYNWFLILGVLAGTITIGFMINKYLQEMFLMKMGIMIAIAGGAFLLAKKMTNGKLSLGFIKAFSTKKLNE